MKVSPATGMHMARMNRLVSPAGNATAADGPIVVTVTVAVPPGGKEVLDNWQFTPCAVAVETHPRLTVLPKLFTGFNERVNMADAPAGIDCGVRGSTLTEKSGGPVKVASSVTSFVISNVQVPTPEQPLSHPLNVDEPVGVAVSVTEAPTGKVD
jgi:hypothetical protein